MAHCPMTVLFHICRECIYAFRFMERINPFPTAISQRCRRGDYANTFPRGEGGRASARLDEERRAVLHCSKPATDCKQGDVDMCFAGTLDGGIFLPTALCAQMYWDCWEDYHELVKRVSRRSCITIKQPSQSKIKDFCQLPQRGSQDMGRSMTAPF